MGDENRDPVTGCLSMVGVPVSRDYGAAVYRQVAFEVYAPRDRPPDVVSNRNAALKSAGLALRTRFGSEVVYSGGSPSGPVFLVVLPGCEAVRGAQEGVDAIIRSTVTSAVGVQAITGKSGKISRTDMTLDSLSDILDEEQD